MHLKREIQLIIVAGVNKKLLKWLKKYQDRQLKKMIVYDFTDNITELMEIATLAITKPGGATTAEALTKGLPMVIIKPLPGQENHNTDFLLKKGVAVRFNRLDTIGKEVDGLLNSPTQLLKMRKAAYENSRPNSSLDIARLILE